MAFLKTTRAQGGGDILINLDHVLTLRPAKSQSDRTEVTFVQYDDDTQVKTLNVNTPYAELAADFGHFDGSVLPTP